jgi:hypothetical protein
MPATDGLVSPVPTSFAALRLATRAENLDEADLGLVDSMLGRGPTWGAGILDAVERTARARWPRCSTTRIARPQVGVHEPDRWVMALAAKHAAIVIAVGD